MLFFFPFYKWGYVTLSFFLFCYNSENSDLINFFIYYYFFYIRSSSKNLHCAPGCFFKWVRLSESLCLFSCLTCFGFFFYDVAHLLHFISRNNGEDSAVFLVNTMPSILWDAVHIWWLLPSWFMYSSTSSASVVCPLCNKKNCKGMGFGVVDRLVTCLTLMQESRVIVPS